MFFDDIKQLVIQVLKSREVLAAAAAFIVFVILVDYVGSPTRRQIHISIPKLSKREKKPKPAAGEEAEADEPEEARE